MGFEFRRLLVYSKIIDYRRLSVPLLLKLKRRDLNLAGQVERNGNSMGSNTAEGASEDRPKLKAHYYRIAKRETEEAAANWEQAEASGFVTADEIAPLLKLLDEVARMLAALVRRFDQ